MIFKKRSVCEQQVRNYCKRYKIKLHENPYLSNHGRCNTSYSVWPDKVKANSHKITISSNFKNERIKYIVTMHEIGHAVTWYGLEKNNIELLKSEIHAWDWALDNSILPITEEIELYKEQCLDTYRALIP